MTDCYPQLTMNELDIDEQDEYIKLMAEQESQNMQFQDIDPTEDTLHG